MDSNAFYFKNLLSSFDHPSFETEFGKILERPNIGQVSGQCKNNNVPNQHAQSMHHGHPSSTCGHRDRSVSIGSSCGNSSSRSSHEEGLDNCDTAQMKAVYQMHSTIV